MYAFSTENWSRDPLEVSTLMSIFAKYAASFKTEALGHNVKVNVLTTDSSKLPTNVQEAVAELEKATAKCTSFTVNICLRYSSCKICAVCLCLHVILQLYVCVRCLLCHLHLTHVLLSSYGSRGELVNACKQISSKVQCGEVQVENINEQLISASLCTGDCPGTISYFMYVCILSACLNLFRCMYTV